MGVTFKENCPDIRNSKAFKIYDYLTEIGLEVSIYDPLGKPDQIKKEYNVSTIEYPLKANYGAICIAVCHKDFIAMGVEHIRSFGVKDALLFDVKCVFPKQEVDWRL